MLSLPQFLLYKLHLRNNYHKDPSFWPYLTALFGDFMAIKTIVLLYRAKHTVIKEKQEPSAELSIEKDFQATFENQGPIQA